jgi:hypothetical protein
LYTSLDPLLDFIPFILSIAILSTLSLSKYGIENALITLYLVAELRDTELRGQLLFAVVDQTSCFERGLSRSQKCDVLAILLQVLQEETGNL